MKTAIVGGRPVKLSAGWKARVHPIGATGVSSHGSAVMRLTARVLRGRHA